MTVLGHWSSGGPRGRVWTRFDLQLATSKASIALVSRDHVVPNPRPSEQLHWWLSKAVPMPTPTLKPVNAPMPSCSNPTARSRWRKQVLRLRHVPDYVLSIADDEDGRSRSWELGPHVLSSWDENRSRLRDPGSTSTGWMTSVPIVRRLSAASALRSPATDPNHRNDRTSVFLAFSWRRFDAHYSETAMIQSCRLATILVASYK